ncbi:hypothetical protein QTP86_001464 [Hemibagrus guttatus]|nr:hypothetical protein QTP86_001464 [Hemibagrus guttatus]
MWLSDRVPDTAIQLTGLTSFCADRNAALCGKTRNGGVCVYINMEWCKNSVLFSSYCSSLVEFVTVRCRPFYLPCEFTTAFIFMYIAPSANAKEALCELYGAISELQNAEPDGLFIITGDFNHANLKTVLPKFHQHVDFSTRGTNMLDLVYKNTTCSNQKLWMTAKVRALLKSRDSALRAGDKTALKIARAKLSRAIREATCAHAQRIHGHFKDSKDSQGMWQGIQAITNYKTTLPACDSDTSLPDTLNDFYTQFKVQNNIVVRKAIPLLNDQALCLSMADVKRTLCRLNPWKSAGPDNIPGRVLRECAEQLADVFTDIFKVSLSSTIVPTCLKTMTIIPVPKKSTVSCLNDYHTITLTPIVMKCFERLVMRHIKTQLPPSLDPLEFAYRPNRSTEDAITTTLHLALTHLDNKDSYV